MQEAEYCDRVAIMDSGQVLAQGSPARDSRAAPGPSARPEPSMEDAFIAVVEQARAPEQARRMSGAHCRIGATLAPPKLRRIRALVCKETRQVCAIPRASRSASSCR